MAEPAKTTRPIFVPGSIVKLYTLSPSGDRVRVGLFRTGATPGAEVFRLTRWEVLRYRVGKLFRWVRPLWWKVCPGAERRFFEKIKGR